MDEKKILVVDDEKLILEIFKEAFTRAGYKVSCASSGEEALEILKKEDIQVIFLDLKMPGMDGLELCGRIRVNRPTAVITAVTGHASGFDRVACLEAGFDGYFTKSIDLKVLVEAAHDAFKKLEGS